MAAGPCKRKKQRMTSAINASSVPQNIKDAAINAIVKMKSMKEQTSNLSTYRNIKTNLKTGKVILDEQLVVVWAHAEGLKLLDKHLQGTAAYQNLGRLQTQVLNVDFNALPQLDVDDNDDADVADENDEEVVEAQSSDDEETDPYGVYKIIRRMRAKIQDANLLSAESEELQLAVSKMSSKFTKAAGDAKYWESKSSEYRKSLDAMLDDPESYLMTQNTQLALKLAEACETEASLQKQIDDGREQLEADRMTHEMAQHTLAFTIDNIVKNSRMEPSEREIAKQYLSMAKQNHADVLGRQQDSYLANQLNAVRRDCTEAMVKLAQAENTVAKQNKLITNLTTVRSEKGVKYNAFDVANAIWFDRTGEQCRMKGRDKAAREYLDETAKTKNNVDEAANAELNDDPFVNAALRVKRRLDYINRSSSAKRQRADSGDDDANGGEGSSKTVTTGSKGAAKTPINIEDDSDDDDSLDDVSLGSEPNRGSGDYHNVDEDDEQEKRPAFGGGMKAMKGAAEMYEEPTLEELQQILGNYENATTKGKGKEIQQTADDATVNDIPDEQATAQDNVQTAQADVPDQTDNHTSQPDVQPPVAPGQNVPEPVPQDMPPVASVEEESSLKTGRRTRPARRVAGRKSVGR